MLIDLQTGTHPAKMLGIVVARATSNINRR
jgi:hypothetical protein